MAAADYADSWWNGLPPDRRVQIWQWIERDHATHRELPGQYQLPLTETRPRKARP